MAKAEKNLTAHVLMSVSKIGARLFRQNTGLAWQGEIIEKTPQRLILKNPRPIHCGLIKGSSDLIGWTPVVITADMVGKTVAIFTALEVKTPGVSATPEQKNFVEQIAKVGGCGHIVRSAEEAVAAINGAGK